MPFTQIYANSRFQPETRFFPASRPSKPGLLVFSREIKVKVSLAGVRFFTAVNLTGGPGACFGAHTNEPSGQQQSVSGKVNIK